MGTIVPGILINTSCCKNKKKKNRKKNKKWVSADVKFEEKTSDVEKAKIIDETEKQIVESLYKQEFSGFIIKSIRFFVKPVIDANYVNIRVRVIFQTYKEAVDPKGKTVTKPVS